jgi:hypothetical protein
MRFDADHRAEFHPALAASLCGVEIGLVLAGVPFREVARVQSGRTTSVALSKARAGSHSAW